MATEFVALKNSTALIERGDIGRLLLTGNDGLDLLHRLSTNAISPLPEGTLRTTVLTTEKGRVVDHLVVGNLGDRALILTSAGNAPKVVEWIERFCIMEDARVEDVSPTTALLSLIGPRAIPDAAKLFDLDLEAGDAKATTVAEKHCTLLCRSEFHTTFVDILCDATAASEVLSVLKDRCRRQSIPEVSSVAFDRFRIAIGMPAIQHEIVEAYNPYECGLEHTVSFTKGCYVGQEVIARLRTYEKVQREMVGILCAERAVLAQEGAEVLVNDTTIGTLTSVSTPQDGTQLGLAIVKTGVVKPGSQVTLVSNGVHAHARVYHFPLWDRFV